MARKNSLEFHEATVVGVDQVGNSIDIKIHDVSFNRGKINGTLRMDQVGLIKIDGAKSRTFGMERDDGEILDLTLTSHGLELLVEWNDFVHESLTRSYEIDAGSVFFFNDSQTWDLNDAS